MVEILACVLVLILLPVVWAIYGRAAVKTGIPAAVWILSRVVLPIGVGLVGGTAAAIAYHQLGYAQTSSLYVGIIGGLAICLRGMFKSTPWVGAAKARSAPPTNDPPGRLTSEDEAWLRLWKAPPSELKALRSFKCSSCGFSTDESRAEWDVLQSSSACPKCRTPVLIARADPPALPSGAPTRSSSPALFRCWSCGYSADYKVVGACPSCRARLEDDPSLKSSPTGAPDERSTPAASGLRYEEAVVSLRKLRDAGVLSEQEYQQKVLLLAERAGR